MFKRSKIVIEYDACRNLVDEGFVATIHLAQTAFEHGPMGYGRREPFVKKNYGDSRRKHFAQGCDSRLDEAHAFAVGTTQSARMPHDDGIDRLTRI